MTLPNALRFIHRVRGEAELREKIKALGAASDLALLIQIGAEAGPEAPARGDSLEAARVAAGEALKAGDMKRLSQLADVLAAGARSGSSESAHGAATLSGDG